VKTLLVLRHAKAQPDAPSGDWARHLTDRGRRNAQAMGEAVKAMTGIPDAIVSSDANRARQTAEIVAEAIGFDGQVALDHAIYGAGLIDLFEVVTSLPEPAGSVLVVGHNPGFEALAAALAGLDATDVRLPTAGLAHLELDLERWGDVVSGCGRLLAIRTPKDLDA
jgi:phosphohistidine phosphatase